MKTGQQKLARILQTGCIPHALLFCGPKGSEKKKSAYQFALELLKTKKKLENHPDVHLLFPEGKSNAHLIQTMRQIDTDAALAPFEAPWKIFILHEAEKMLPTSSNALLKTLEEPPPQTVIILISETPEKILPTILSRCQMIEFFSGHKKNVDAEVIELLCEGFPKEKIQGLETKEPSLIFETILLWYRDRLLIEIGGCDDLLYFPEYREKIKKISLESFEKIEKGINQAQLAFERSTKLSICLEMLSLQLAKN